MLSSREKTVLAEWCEMSEMAQDETELKTTVTPPRRMGTRIDSPSASVVQVESSKLLPWLLLSTFSAGLSIAMACWASDRAGKAERAAEKAGYEARIIQQHLMDNNALLVRAGILLPSDASHGPAGNIEYNVRKEK